MKSKKRCYNLSSLMSIERFGGEYEFSHHNGYLMPQFFEYAQTHPIFNYGHAHKIALCET